MPEQTTINVTDVSGLVNQVMFLQLHAGLLGNSRKVGGDIWNTPETDKSLLHASKTLLTSPQLDAIRKADMRMRQWLYNTNGPALPCDFDAFMIPNGSIVNVKNKLEAYKTERAALVEEFLAVYIEQGKTAQEKLGPLFNPQDYPSVSQVRAKFYFDYSIFAFGVSEGLKAISQELYQQEVDKLQTTLQSAASEITAAMRQTVYDLLTNLQNKLTPDETTGEKKILHKAAIENVKKFLETFNLKNVTNDTELEAIVGQVRDLLSNTDAQSLRASDSFRDKMRDSLTGITSKLSTMVEIKAGRKFLFDE
jgi:vacuolar-type H+-ATPase subunit E/Vma4